MPAALVVAAVTREAAERREDVALAVAGQRRALLHRLGVGARHLDASVDPHRPGAGVEAEDLVPGHGSGVG
jgi:hypothetical protein